MNNRFQNWDSDGRACAYLEELLVNHLEAIMLKFNGEQAHTPLKFDGMEIWSLIINEHINQLQQDNDIASAALIHSAVNVRTKAATTSWTRELMDNFLGGSVKALLQDGNGLGYLSSILEGLLLEGFPNDEVRSLDSCSSSGHSPPGLTVSVNDSTIFVPFREILSYF